MIGCWLSGTAGFQSRYLEEYCRRRETWGWFPVKNAHNFDRGCAAGGVSAVDGGFYEYVPVEEWHNENPQTVNGDELQDDHEYRLVMTTSVGYYR